MPPPVSFVYPNVSTLKQRGGLAERWKYAEPLGCEYVEVPADFIKKQSEVEATGLQMLAPLTAEAVEALYESTPPEFAHVKYILHTELALSRASRMVSGRKATLAWHDEAWVRMLANMVLTISDFLGHPPAAVEIHPGDPSNSCDDVLNGAAYLLVAFEAHAGTRPLILLENRTDQFICDGEGLALLCDTLKKRHAHLEPHFGVVLDVQQLHTVTGKSLLASLDEIPDEALKAFHIHRKHRAISLDDPIPWTKVFNRIRSLRHPVLMNPEVHHHKQATETVAICRELLAR